jgi:hypothetical protein
MGRWFKLGENLAAAWTETIMDKIHYRIVQHDGGWAYKLGDVFSEPYVSHDAALAAAKTVIQEQHTPGDSVYIEYQDENGRWRTEYVRGDDRPDADVVDDPGRT